MGHLKAIYFLLTPYRIMSRGDDAIEAYQRKPPNILTALKIHSKTEIFHEGVNKNQFLPSRARSDERDNVLMLEVAACQGFLIESLSIYHQRTGCMPEIGATYHAGHQKARE